MTSLINNHQSKGTVHVHQSIIAATVLMFFVGCEQSTTPVAKQAAKPSPVASNPTVEATAQAAPKTEKTKGKVDIPQFLDDALNGKTDLVRLALEAGVDVNAADEEQRTALLLASFNGHTETVELLLKKGASNSQRDSMGRTALMFASTGDSAATVELLINAGAEINAVDSDEGFTALMFAAAEGQVEVVKLLQKHNADASLVDIDGDNALKFATANGHTEVMKLLAE